MKDVTVTFLMGIDILCLITCHLPVSMCGVVVDWRVDVRGEKLAFLDSFGPMKLEL